MCNKSFILENCLCCVISSRAHFLRGGLIIKYEHFLWVYEAFHFYETDVLLIVCYAPIPFYRARMTIQAAEWRMLLQPANSGLAKRD